MNTEHVHGYGKKPDWMSFAQWYEFTHPFTTEREDRIDPNVLEAFLALTEPKTIVYTGEL